MNARSLAMFSWLALSAVAIALPASTVLLAVSQGIAREGLASTNLLPAAGPIARTLAACLLIAAIAWCIGLSIAWPLRTRELSPHLALVLALPLILPPYLAYSGWSALRAPGTALGDWLMTGPGPGLPNPWPTWAGHALAIFGLALAAYPLPTLVLWLGLRAVDRQHGSLHESFALERLTRFAKIRHTLAAMPRESIAAFALVALFMLGSSIPLHLAQLDTLAIDLWRRLDLLPPNESWRLWLSAWPTFVIALTASALLSRHPATPIGGTPAHHRASRWPPRMAMLWIALAVLVPIALHAQSLSGWSALGDFWRVHHLTLLTSAALATCVGVLATALCLLAWTACLPDSRAATTRNRIARVLVLAWVAAGLIPGIFVGLAWVQTTITLEAPLDRSVLDGTPLAFVPLALAHLTRFGFLPVAIGVWLARTTPRDLIDLATIETRQGPRPVIAALLRPRLPAAALAGTIAGLLSLHEIEASVILQPPGTDSLARVMLQNLHYLRDDALGAGVVLITGSVVTSMAILSISHRFGDILDRSKTR